MKKLPLFITLALVGLLVGGYFAYQYFLVKKILSPWNLVPQSTVFVYETNDCPECVTQLQASSIWTFLREAALMDKPIDSVKPLAEFLQNTSSYQLISGHLTRKDDFDFIFYVPITEAQLPILTKWHSIPSNTRSFNNIEIHDLTNTKFSWSLIDNIWVGSFTPFLIEDVIRTHVNTKKTKFKDEISAVYKLPRIQRDAGNFYVSIPNLGQWTASFVKEQPTFIAQLGQSSLLDVRTDNENFVLNGFSVDSASDHYILSLFRDQIPVPFNLKNYVSNRSIMVVDYGLSDGVKFKEALQAYTKSKASTVKDSLGIIGSKNAVDFSTLYATLGKEIGVCYTETKGSNLSKILLIETNDKATWLKTFNTLSQKNSIDTIFYEQFSDYEIGEVPLYNLPEKFFSPLVTGFSTSYYTSVGNVFIIAEDVNDLKRFLDDIDKEDTWGKTLGQNRFLGTTLLESNLSVFINTPMVWNSLTQKLHPKWQKFVNEHKHLLKPIGMGAVQLSHLNNTFYTNATWQFGQQVESKKEAIATHSQIVATFNHGIHAFFPVRNHYTKQEEILIQDSSYAVSLISAEGKTLWKTSLNGFIQGDVSQIDYFNNGKLQLFFATAGKLHLIDRLGNYVKPYPINIPENDVEYASVVDYDHSKKYRFLIAGKSGKLWMYDKEGKNLEGWGPKNTEGSLAAAPQHHRVRGKDYIIAIRKDGVVYLMNRRAETLKNFPLNLDARPTNDYYLETGNSLTNTYFVVVSRDGFRIKFDLNGKIQTRETLIKATPDAMFSLVKELNGKTYAVVRQENTALTIFDANLQEMVVSDFIGKNPTDIRLYDFGGGKIFITLTDLPQELSYVYDGSGTLLTTLPVESFKIELRPSGERMRIFSALEKALTIAPL